MSLRATRTGRTLLIGMAAGLCIAAAVSIAVVLTVDSDGTASKVGFSASAFLLFGLAAAGGVSAIERRHTWWLGLACVTASLAGFVVATVMVWTSPVDGEPPTGLLKAFGALFVAAYALAQVSLLARPNPEGSRRVPSIVLGAQVAVLVLGSLLVGAILGEVGDETYYRWVGVASAIWLLGTALVPLSRRLARSA